MAETPTCEGVFSCPVQITAAVGTFVESVTVCCLMTRAQEQGHVPMWVAGSRDTVHHQASRKGMESSFGF